MKRTHLATEAAVGALLEHFEEYRAIPKKGKREGAMQQLAYRVAGEAVAFRHAISKTKTLPRALPVTTAGELGLTAQDKTA